MNQLHYHFQRQRHLNYNHAVLIYFDRDHDQIKADLRSPKHLAQYQATKAVEDLPGLGEFYCVECAKWFEGENSQVTHLKGKNHKRRYSNDILEDGILAFGL